MALLEVLYSVVNCGCNVLGIAFNLILILAVLLNSPPQIRTYGFLLVANAVTDTLTCLITLWIQPRVVTFHDTLVYINNGICKYFTPNSCIFGYSIMVVFYAHMTWSLLVSFAYRWYVLQYEASIRKLYMLFLIALIYIPMIVEYCIVVREAFNSITLQLMVVHPELNVNSLVITGSRHALTDWRAVIPTAAITMPIFPVTVIIIVLRKKILKKLEQQAAITETSRRMHKDFLQALTLQTFLPPLMVLGICLFTVDLLFQIHHVILEEGLYFIMGLIPMISPIFPLYFVKPYRSFVVVTIFRRRSIIVSNLASDAPANSDLQSIRVISY